MTSLWVLKAVGLIALAAIVIFVASLNYIAVKNNSKAVGIGVLFSFPTFWIAFVAASAGVIWLSFVKR